MMHFLLGLPAGNIRRNPYVAVTVEPPPLRAAEVGLHIHPRGLLYCVPGISSWAGGDITAGILAVGLHEREETAMLIDVGTNGEIVLGNKDCRSGVKALADNPRNIDDQQIKACAAKGGVIGLSPWGPMVLKKGSTRRPTLEEFMRQIDHVAELLGSTDHIGIGTDMSLGTYPDHISDVWGDAAYKDFTASYDEHISANIRSPLRMVEGFSNYPEVMNLIAGLKKRGLSEADIRNILGGNYLRVFKQVWR